MSWPAFFIGQVNTQLSDIEKRPGPNQPTGDPVEDARRFSHPATRPNDGRTLINREKLERAATIILTGSMAGLPEKLKELRLTAKEKAAIMSDPEFKDLMRESVLARMFDIWFKLAAYSRSDDRFLKPMMLHTGVIKPPENKDDKRKLGSMALSAKKIIIEQEKPSDTIDVEAEQGGDDDA